jgi:hypothetical protein
VKIPITFSLCKALMKLRMHKAKKRKKNYKKEKSHNSDLFFATTDQTPPRQHPKFFLYKTKPPRCELFASAVIALIMDHKFSPRRDSTLTK